MRPPEWIALVYFGLIAASAVIGPFEQVRTRVLARTALVIFLIVTFGEQNTRAAQHVRDWLPGLYAVFGYWIPGMLAKAVLNGSASAHRFGVRVTGVRAAGARLQSWLQRSDAPMLPQIERLVASGPRLLLEYLELAYLCCYALVPCAFLWLALNGHVNAADRYWTTVLLALFPCYGLVAWLPTRPPRAIEPSPAVSRRRLTLHPLNLAVLNNVSIQINTFPSGHTAGALAAAAVVSTMMPLSGVVVGVVALSIAVASVVGRYHYAADAVTGALVALGAFGVAEWWFRLHPLSS